VLARPAADLGVSGAQCRARSGQDGARRPAGDLPPPAGTLATADVPVQSTPAGGRLPSQTGTGEPARTVEPAAGTAGIAGTRRVGQPLLTAVAGPSAGPAGGADLRLLGELDLATAPVLAHLLEAQIDSGHLEVGLDLAELVFCDLRGLHALLQGRRRLVEVGGRLTLARPRPLLTRIAALTGLAAELGLAVVPVPTPSAR